jgi:hypothetical protein
MILVQYYRGVVRCGLLAWRECPDGTLQALGGYDAHGEPGEGAITLVTTDADDRVLRGWVHPDHIREISGEDGSGMAEFPPADAAP